MEHYKLIAKYEKAQRHYEKGNYRRARSIFDMIVFEIYCSDSDSMADLKLCEYAEEYLSKIARMNIPKFSIQNLIANALELLGISQSKIANEISTKSKNNKKQV